MKRIIDLVPKPSDAINAMVSGLLKQSARKDFIIDMTTFGVTRGNICFGCAATCTLQEISSNNLATNIDISGPLARSITYNLEFHDVCRFEYAIDNLRCGILHPLLSFYNYAHKELDIIAVVEENSIVLSRLNNDNWHENISGYKQLANLLKKKYNL